MERTVALGSLVCTLVVSNLFLYILLGFLVSGLVGSGGSRISGLMGVERVLRGLKGS